MTDQVVTLLVVLVVFLTVLTGVFVAMLIIVLVTLKKTLDRLHQAIDNVEDTAMRSLAPFLSFKAMFSDTHGFLTAATKVVKAIQGKKNKN